MVDRIFNTRLKNKIDTTANWAESDLILKDGELALERTETGAIKAKVGDDEHTWNQLNYITNEIELDNAPTENSNNLLTSGSIYAALETKNIVQKEKIFSQAFESSDYTFLEENTLPFIVPPGENPELSLSDNLYNTILNYMKNNKTTYLNSLQEPLVYTNITYIDEDLNNVYMDAWGYNVTATNNDSDINITINDNGKEAYVFIILRLQNDDHGVNIKVFSVQGTTELLNWNFYQDNKITRLDYDKEPTQNSDNLITSGNIYNALGNRKVYIYPCTTQSSTISLPNNVTLQEIYEASEQGAAIYLNIDMSDPGEPNKNQAAVAELATKLYDSSTSMYTLIFLFHLKMNGQIVHVILSFENNATSTQLQTL